MSSDSSFFNVFGFGGPKIKRIRIRRDIDISQQGKHSSFKKGLWLLNQPGQHLFYFSMGTLLCNPLNRHSLGSFNFFFTRVWGKLWNDLVWALGAQGTPGFPSAPILLRSSVAVTWLWEVFEVLCDVSDSQSLYPKLQTFQELAALVHNNSTCIQIFHMESTSQMFSFCSWVRFISFQKYDRPALLMDICGLEWIWEFMIINIIR